MCVRVWPPTEEAIHSLKPKKDSNQVHHPFSALHSKSRCSLVGRLFIPLNRLRTFSSSPASLTPITISSFFFILKPRFKLGLHSLGGHPQSGFSSSSPSLKFMQRVPGGGARSRWILRWILHCCSSDSPPDWFSCCPIVAPCIIYPPLSRPHCLSFLLPSILTLFGFLHTFCLCAVCLSPSLICCSLVFDNPLPSPSGSILSGFLVADDKRGPTREHAKRKRALKYHVSVTRKENDS